MQHGPECGRPERCASLLDLPGMLSFGGALTFLVWALIGANVDGWSSGPTVGKFAAAGALLACFIAAEFLQHRPMISGTLRFVGLVIGLTGLGTVLARETESYLLQADPAGMVAGIGAHGLTSRIIAGAVAQAAQPVQAALREVARRSFAAGFAEVLVAAGLLAILGAILTYSLIDKRKTAVPIRPISSSPD